MIWGIDFDTHQITISVFENVENPGPNDYVISHQVVAKGKTWKDRSHILGKDFRDVVDMYQKAGVDHVLVEESLYHYNPNTTIAMSFILGIICFLCADVGWNVTLVKNNSWKKYAIGSGKATKDEIREKISTFLNIPNDLHQDLYDSCGVALYYWKIREEATR